MWTAAWLIIFHQRMPYGNVLLRTLDIALRWRAGIFVRACTIDIALRWRAEIRKLLKLNSYALVALAPPLPL